jgi:hypothetical protein
MQENPTRRGILLAAGATALIQWPKVSASMPQWLPIAAEEAGFATDLDARLDRAIAEKRVWNLHGLVVVRNERLVLERYFEGEDNVRGVGPIGRVTFTPDTMHDLRSCSKSIVALLYGIALALRDTGHERR